MDFGIPSVSHSATHEEEEEVEEEESQPPLKVFVSQFQNSTGNTNSFPIRALPSNDSDIETSIYIDQPLQVSISSSGSSSVSVDSFESEEFVSGDEEFEIERTFIADPDEETLEIFNEVDDSNALFVEPVLGFSDFLPAKILMPPKARVSGEDDEGFVSEVEEEEEEEEDGFSGVVRVSSPVGVFWESDNIVEIPKVRVLCSEKEEEEYYDDDDDEGEKEEISFSNVALEPSEDGFTGNDFMGNCKIIDEVSANGQREDGPFVEVKRMCLSGFDTGHIELEENEFAEKKATEVLVKTSTRFSIQSGQEVFNVDGCFVSKFVETDFGEENSSTGDINKEQNLEPMITNPAIEILELADFAIEEEDDCEKKRSSFGESISKHLENGGTSVIVQRNELKDPFCCNTLKCASALSSILKPEVKQDNKDEVNPDPDSGKEHEGSISDEDAEVVKFDGYESFEEIMRESMQGSGVNYHLGAESSWDQSHKNNRHMVMEFDKEVHTDEVGDKKDLFDPSMLAALPNAASSAVSHSGNIGMTSSDGSTISFVKHPACFGSSIGSQQPTPRPTQSNSVPSEIKIVEDFVENLTGEAKKRLETIQLIRVKFLRLLQRLGHSPEDSAAEQVLHQLFLVSGRQTSQAFGLETARRTAMQLEAEGKDDLDLSLNILVLGKAGVGKSATINYLFGEDKTRIDAFEPDTAAVKEIVGTVHGVKIRVFDTPGLRTSVMEQTFNKKVFLSVKKVMKKCPPDTVFYVDRLDIQTRDLNDIPLLRSITDTLGLPIWESVILTLTHAASDPPDGPLGFPLSYEAFVAQRSLAVQHSISRAVGQLHMMNHVSLVENHRLGRCKEDHRVLPNDQNWRANLLLMCYSMKILSELNSLSKAQYPRKFFGPYVRFPPLPYLLSTLLQSRPHLKIPDNQGGDDAHTVVELEDFLESSQEEEDKYEQLPPFKPLRRSQIDMLSKKQKKAYLDEYDYRFKLLQKKQWKDELKKLKEMKKKRKYDRNDYNDIGQDQSTLRLSLTKWKGGLELRTNLQSQFSVGRSSKIAVGLGLNKHGGQHTIRTSSSDQLQVALVGVFPIAIAIFRSIWPGNDMWTLKTFQKTGSRYESLSAAVKLKEYVVDGGEFIGVAGVGKDKREKRSFSSFDPRR